MRWPSSLLVLLLAAVFTGGCGQDDIKVYSVPKEQPAPAGMPADHPDFGSEPPAPQLTWQLPAGWTEGAPSEFRLASFRIKDADGKEADVSIVPLSGIAGGDLSNVNRWRGQVSQPPVSDAELKQLAQSVELAGQPAELYEQAGKGPTGAPTRILAAIQHRAGTAWFFKMTGDDELVVQQKPIFIGFLKSVQFAAGEPPAEVTADHPKVAPTPNAAPSSAGQPKWTAPADWKAVAGGQFLVAKFVIAGTGGAQAAVNVSSSAGNGGGVAANVNRWRKQLGLAEVADDELMKSVKTVNAVTFVAMNGTDARSGQPAALVGAMVFQPGQAWFYKLMGEAKVVAAQKDAFIKFVDGVEY